MRAAALLPALFGLNACSNAIVNASFNSNAVAPALANGSVASVHVVSSSGAASVAGALAFAAFVDARDPSYMDMGPSSSFAAPYSWFWTRSVPELDPGRRISEQDCTKPLDLSQGNIRCK